jgi:GDP-L-fucose synthase
MNKKFRNKKILITGGEGFLGKNLKAKLKEKKYKNIIIISHKKFNLTLTHDVKKMFKKYKPQIVFHLAAAVGGIGINKINSGKFFYENAMINLNVIHEAYINKVEKIISTGSVSSYPMKTPLPLKEKNLWDGYPEEINASYGIAKRLIHSQSLSYKKQYKFKSILLLLTNLYGPLDNFNPKTSHVVASLIKKFVEAKIKNKKQVVVWGNGKATRDFCYVEDITEGLILTAEKYNLTEPLNLGSGHQVSIKKIAKIIKKLIDYKGSIKWDLSKPVGTKKRFLSIGNAKKKIGFRVKTSIENGLEKTINWYLSEKIKY